jgi:hypothetical protein
VVLIEVCPGVRGAHLWKAAAPWLEPHESVLSGHLPLEIRGVVDSAAWLDALTDGSGITVSSRLRTILAVRPFWTVAYFAHASVLPVNKAIGPALLRDMGRTVRLVMPMGRLAWSIWPSWRIWYPRGYRKLRITPILRVNPLGPGWLGWGWREIHGQRCRCAP